MVVTLMRSFEVYGVEYQLLNDKKHLIVRRTPKNDNADDPYRWGIKTCGGWKVYLKNNYQMSLGGVYERLTPEDVAKKMYKADSCQIDDGR